MGESVSGPTNVPPAVFVDREYLDLIGKKRTSFNISFSSSVRNGPYFLVIDIYSASCHSHPDGHVGWWTYSHGVMKDVAVTIERKEGALRVFFQHDREVQSKWVNEVQRFQEEPVFALHAVLRNSENNALVHDTTVYLYCDRPSLQAAQERRNNLESIQGDPLETCRRWYCWPARTTVRVVSQDIREHDALGNFSFDLYRLFRSNGVPVRLYARRFDPTFRGLVSETAEVIRDAQKHDLIFYNFSIFDPYFEALSGLSARKILFYHNITPPRMFLAYEAEYSLLCSRAYEQLSLAERFDAIVANSHASYRQLKAILEGQQKTLLPEHLREEGSLDRPAIVCPPFLNCRRWNAIKAEPVSLPEASDILLFVGRVAPHKKIEDLISLFNSYYRINPASALVVVGQTLIPGYSIYLDYLINKRFGHLKDRILFMPGISEGQLKWVYQRSSAFVSMSEHEGFCIPLVEAMYFEKPVFAFAQEAVTETMASTGLVFYEKNFDEIAEEINTVLTNAELRDRIVARQNRRFSDIQKKADGHLVWEAVERALFANANPL